MGRFFYYLYTMQILFDAFVYPEEILQKIDTGLIAEEDVDIFRDCTTKPILINVKEIITARPEEKGRATSVCDGSNCFTLKIPFTDYVKLIPHSSARMLTKKWAN